MDYMHTVLTKVGTMANRSSPYSTVSSRHTRVEDTINKWSIYQCFHSCSHFHSHLFPTFPATHRHSKAYSAKLRLATPSSLSNCHRNAVTSVKVSHPHAPRT